MLPLASARCSPPPQKFLQLMGNPHHIPRQLRPPGWDGARAPGVPRPWHSSTHLPRVWVSGSRCGDEQSQGAAGAQCPRGDAGAASALHHLVPGGSSTAQEEEEEEKGLVLVLLGHHKPEVRPCTHPAPSVPLEHQA